MAAAIHGAVGPLPAEATRAAAAAQPQAVADAAPVVVAAVATVAAVVAAAIPTAAVAGNRFLFAFLPLGLAPNHCGAGPSFASYRDEISYVISRVLLRACKSCQFMARLWTRACR